MKPIISPWLIYFLSVLDGINLVCGGIFILGLIGIPATLFIIYCMNDDYWGGEKNAVQKAFSGVKPYIIACVFGGSSNTMDFLPLDRSGNRRFLPIMVHPENAEVHILEDEAASRAFIDMMWAEVMFIYQNFPVKLTLSKDMDKHPKDCHFRQGKNGLRRAVAV